MNLNHFQTTSPPKKTLLSQVSSNLSKNVHSIPAAHLEMYNKHLQASHNLTVPYQPVTHKHVPSTDFAAEPTKRVKLNQYGLAQNPRKIQETAYETTKVNRNDHRKALDCQDFSPTIKIPMLQMPVAPLEVPENSLHYDLNMLLAGRKNQMNLTLDDNMTYYGLFDIIKRQQLERYMMQQQLARQQEIKQHLFRQLEQQQHHYFPQPTMTQHLLQMNQNQLAFEYQQKEQQSDQTLLKRSPLIQEDYPQKNQADILIKAEILEQTPVVKPLQKEELHQSQEHTKKRKGTKEEMQASQKVEKGQPRRKNKWQILAESNQDKLNETQEIQEQEILEEKDVDYEYLQSITITNDPTKIGRENPHSEFVVITKDTKINEEDNEQKSTPVGDRYQVKVPDLCTKPLVSKLRRKTAEPVWNPSAIDKKELKEYFENLSRLLKCEIVYQDRALKLLKRKKYQREKVYVNIFKNEKFYSSFLVAANAANQTSKETSLL